MTHSKLCQRGKNVLVTISQVGRGLTRVLSWTLWDRCTNLKQISFPLNLHFNLLKCQSVPNTFTFSEKGTIFALISMAQKETVFTFFLYNMNWWPALFWVHTLCFISVERNKPSALSDHIQVCSIAPPSEQNGNFSNDHISGKGSLTLTYMTSSLHPVT